MIDHSETREEQAAREVGHTEVSPIVARGLTIVFLTLLVGVASIEIARDAARGSGLPWPELASAPTRALGAARPSGLLAQNRQLLAAMNRFEDALDERSAVAERVLPTFQWVLSRFLGMGNEQVVQSRGEWLYFRSGIDYLTGPGFLEPRVLARKRTGGDAWGPRPQPDPLPAIADFAAQLADRGIGLVIVPTPVKAALHPEGLAPGSTGEVPLTNESMRGFLARLSELEIPVFDPSEALAATRRDKAWPLFLRTDTHWTPQAMEETAQGLAGFLRRHVALPERNPVAFTRRQVGVEGRGDLATLLRLPDSHPLFRKESVLTQPVATPTGEPWTPDPEADILVLGDSFTNIYSQAPLGFGESAGLAEQLSYFLSRPVDKLAVNAGGPSAARERLAASLAAGRDRLAGKRLVVYQFSARELAIGDWRLVDLTSRESPETATPRASARGPEDPLPARGFVTWESNRTGDWRIWMRRLEGSPPRQLSPDEADLQHCCAHISPDGSRVAYLSRRTPKDEYPEEEVAGELRVIRPDGTEERTLVVDARPYGWGNRSVVWRNDQSLIYIDADGRTRLLDLDGGASSLLTSEPQGRLAWLIDATLSHAATSAAKFCAYDAPNRRIGAGQRRPGCEPYFSHDGRFGFWNAGGGGPIHWIEFGSGTTGTVVDKDDRRLHSAQRYVYFPMLSRDDRMLVFGASAGDHDHFRSNYDIFAAPLEPGSFELAGRPLRLTSHPATDRYPDVHVDDLELERWRLDAPPDPLPDASPPPPPGRPFQARAILQFCSRVPSLREISPYRDALVVCEWQVGEVLSGDAPGARVRVAHWGLRDGERQPIAFAESGLTALLGAEPLAASLQVEGYTISDTLPEAAELSIYFAREP